MIILNSQNCILKLRRVSEPRWAPGSAWCCSPCRARHCPGGNSPCPPPHYSAVRCSQHTWGHHHYHVIIVIIMIITCSSPRGSSCPEPLPWLSPPGPGWAWWDGGTRSTGEQTSGENPENSASKKIFFFVRWRSDLNAVNLICSVHSERNPVQALGADHASEAVWMVRLACKETMNFPRPFNWILITRGPEDSVEDGLKTLAAPLQRVEITVLTVRLALHSVEWKTLQSAVTL